MTDRPSYMPAKKTSYHLETENADETCSNEEIEAVRGCVAAFATATKNYALYPKEHANSKNLLSSFDNSLRNFFRTSPVLRFDLEKERICYKGIEIYRPKEKEDYLVTPFFRDGINWIEFAKGVSKTELSFILHILNEYRMLKDESEGDLVTALWKKDLPHIHYEASEVYWESEPKLDFSHFIVPALLKNGKQEPVITGGSGVGRYQPGDSENGKDQATVSIVAGQDRAVLLKLTSDEKELLQKMIVEEEKRNLTQDVLEVLLILLEDQDDTEAFSDILEVLTDEFETMLRHGEFRLAIEMLRHLKKLSDSHAAPDSWRIALIDQFFETVSDPELLGGLKEYLSTRKSANNSQLKELRQFLTILRPKAVLTLGPLLSEVSSAALRRRLMEAIAVLSKEDLDPLTQLLKMTNEILIQQFVIILGHLDGGQSHKLLLQTARHPSLRVRRESLKQLLKRNGRVKHSFFFMLEDPSDIIRRDILNRLASERNKSSEDLLRQYLDERAYKISDRGHILTCYGALGKCGSLRSLPFLKSTLQGRPWSDAINLSQSIHRRGAAMALAELRKPETHEILEQAARSFFPQIKRAARAFLLKNGRYE